LLTGPGALSSVAHGIGRRISPAADPSRLMPPAISSPEFSIPTSNLDAGGKQFRLPVLATWLRGALEGTSIQASDRDGELDVRLSKSGVDVVVRGTLAAELVVPCSRCLEPTAVPVREELSVLAVPAASHGRAGRAPSAEDGDEGDEDDQGEADVIPYDGETVVLDDLVRDELLLGIPMIPLCSEACPGIRPERQSRDTPSAADENIDPRLRPLLRLKNKT
jgi:uncharacterized protein